MVLLMIRKTFASRSDAETAIQYLENDGWSVTIEDSEELCEAESGDYAGDREEE